MKQTILLTGANGQLGNELRQLVASFSAFEWIFTDIEELDISNTEHVEQFFEKYHFKFCINTAAYTAVDKAESDTEKAQEINANAVRNLVQQCQKFETTLIQISTDFVFEGTKNTPYFETDSSNPLSIYGKTKLDGEKEALENPKTFVIRTSWLYSEFGHNFVKTMLHLAKNRNELRIIADQIGTPTYAHDLAKCILTIIEKVQSEGNFEEYGIYHFSNEGVASWYDFAHAIFELKNQSINLIPIPTEDYPTPAVRPKFSILDKRKIKQTFGIQIPHWHTSLKMCLGKL